MNIEKFCTMKNRGILFGTILILVLALFTGTVSAQVITGPSDATTPPPTSATQVGKVLCAGTPISITGPQDVTGVDYPIYHWYKLDASGNKQLTASTGKTYTETPTASGYYNYELVTESAGGCTSPISDVFKVFVLPPLTATITATGTAICV